MTTIEFFNKTEEALKTIGLSMDDFYVVDRSAIGVALQGKYCEKIVKALTPANLTINQAGGWVQSKLMVDDVEVKITLTW